MPHCTQSLQIDYTTFEPPEKTPIQPSSFSGIPYTQRCCPPTCTARCCRPTCPFRYDQPCVPPSKSPSQTTITISVSTSSLNQFCKPSCEACPPAPSPPTFYHQPQFNPSLYREACCFPLTVPLPPRCYLNPPKPSSMQPVGCPPCEPCPPPCKVRPSTGEPGLPCNSSTPSCPPCPCPSPFEPGTPCNLSRPCCIPLGDSFPSACRPSTPCNQSPPNVSSPCEPCPPPCEPCASPCNRCIPCANCYSCSSPSSPCTMPCGPCPCSSPCSPCAMPCGPCPCSPHYLCPIPCDPCSSGEHCKCDPGTAPCGPCSCSPSCKYLSPCDICPTNNSIQPSSDSGLPPFPCESCTTPCDPCIPPPCKPCLPRPCAASAACKPCHHHSTSSGQPCLPHVPPLFEPYSHSSSPPCIPRVPHSCEYGSPCDSLSSNEECSSLSNFWEPCDPPARDPGPTICYSIPKASAPTPIQCLPPSPCKSPRICLPPFCRPPWVNPCIATRNPYCCRTAPCTICNCIPCNCTSCECDPCKTCDTECNTYASCDVACSPCCPCDRACSPCPLSESKDEACGPGCPCQSLKDPCSPTYDIFRQECPFPKDPVKFIMVWDPADHEEISSVEAALIRMRYSNFYNNYNIDEMAIRRRRDAIRLGNNNSNASTSRSPLRCFGTTLDGTSPQLRNIDVQYLWRVCNNEQFNIPASPGYKSALVKVAGDGASPKEIMMYSRKKKRSATIQDAYYPKCLYMPVFEPTEES